VPFTVWREDGSVWAKGTTVASQQDGDYTEWYPDGKVAAQGRYFRGEKVGKWSYFDGQGNPSEMAQGDGAH
jgi:antitoxin component YwqK of YwqJK toxin-antitoxin module